MTAGAKPPVAVVALFVAATAGLAAEVEMFAPGGARGRTFFVRQTVGDDGNDGGTPQTAWRSLRRLSRVMQAGDTAYVGPGLYREAVNLQHGGAPGARLMLVADPTGRRTGDPPGPVLLTGAEPVDETIFAPHSAAGVYTARFDAFEVLGVVEMDGDQRRLTGVKEPVTETPYLDRVAATAGSYYYDQESRTLYLHTSDGRAPATHEIELIRHYSGILAVNRPYVTVAGFIFRHYGDSGVSFRFSPHGVVVEVVVFGSRQGIRVRESDHVLAAGNTLFRNENSGLYFLQGSSGGVAVDNVSYENVKGLRWSSGSTDGVAVNNTLFDNREAGLALEKADRALLRGNRLVGNAAYQLMLLNVVYDSDGNCYGGRDSATPLVLFFPSQAFASLAAYQQASRQDRASRHGDCGPLPEKVDVHRLHAESLAYTEAARTSLEEAVSRSIPQSH